jgi:hypothetical protein
MKKYLICPGQIKSKYDGNIHYIGEVQLISLYGVDPSDCLILGKEKRGIGHETDKLIKLYPRYSGDYREWLYQQEKRNDHTI